MIYNAYWTAILYELVNHFRFANVFLVSQQASKSDPKTKVLLLA